MTPQPDSRPAPADALRRQLILAQVQLMELEDARDDLRSRLAAANDLLAQTQTLADRSLQDRERLAADLQERLAAQQAATESLRSELSAALGRESALAARVATLEPQLASATRNLAATTATAAARQERIVQLETERLTMKSSWSWRCTAPLRALGRLLHRGGPSA